MTSPRRASLKVTPTSFISVSGFSIKAFAVLFVALIIVASASVAEAQNDSRTVRTSSKRRGTTPAYGRIELTTTTGEYPVSVDGQPNGTSSPTVRYLDLEPGSRTVEVQFPNGAKYVNTFNIIAGRKYCIVLNYRPRTVRIENPVVSPCPYTVAVSAPASVSDGDLITFTSDAAYNGASALNYTWTVSPAAARITSGAGTPTVTVDSTGLGNQRVTAILVVDDGSGDRNCRQSAQASTAILTPVLTPVTPTRFDEFPSVNFDDDKARLDNLAIELQNAPTATGYIIIYQGRRSSPRAYDRLTNRTRNYLVNTRGIDASRVTVVGGGQRERDYFELYIVPRGAEPPQPR
ncbi:MAG: hypothetical protein MSG64_06115 [Pyrinomonadaceae bacterium MAG19_C2-C3]|nr:hypothetical protein [Pyrinomonadaceae bacterium MAG19_C2-C3]